MAAAASSVPMIISANDKPRDFHVERPAEVKTNDRVTEGDGEEGREDDRVDDAVQRQPLEIIRDRKLASCE